MSKPDYCINGVDQELQITEVISLKNADQSKIDENKKYAGPRTRVKIS